MANPFETIDITEVPRPIIDSPLGVQAARLILQELHDPPIPNPTDSEIERQCASMDTDYGEVFAALSTEAAFLGTGSLLFFEGPIAVIADLVVDPSVRRGGVASKLLSHLENRAREIRAIEACLFPSSEEYHGFYNKRGYQEEERAYAASGKSFVKPL